jgi:hypothetical protein
MRLCRCVVLIQEYLNTSNVGTQRAQARPRRACICGHWARIMTKYCTHTHTQTNTHTQTHTHKHTQTQTHAPQHKHTRIQLQALLHTKPLADFFVQCSDFVPPRIDGPMNHRSATQRRLVFIYAYIVYSILYYICMYVSLSLSLSFSLSL